METVSDLIAHYRSHELTPERKAFATIESTTIYLSSHIGPRWGESRLSGVRTVEVESWIDGLCYAPGSRLVYVRRSCVRNHLGDVKTEASGKPVPLHESVIRALAEWRNSTPYKDDGDFLFPSLRLNGKQPLSPDTLLKKTIRPALRRAGVVGKVIGWHSFRHSLATNLRAAGVEIKTAQELLRHANSRITLDLYTRAISSTKRDANDTVMAIMLGSRQ